MKFSAVLLICFALPALAVERVVVMTRPGGLVEAVVRLKAELRTAGFEVVEAPIEADPGPRSLARVANTFEATAVIALDPQENEKTVDLWVQDRISGKTVTRTLEIVHAPTPSLLARRSVDLLQASFLELLVRPAAAASPAAIVALMPPPPVQRPARVHLQLGGVVAGQPGFEVALATAVSVEVRIAGPVWVSAGLLGPTLLGELKGPFRAAIQQLISWGSAQLHFTPVSWGEVVIVAGAGGQHLTARGLEDGSSGGDVWTWVVNAGASATWWAGAYIGLRGGLDFWVAPQPVRLLVGGGEVGRAGAPMVVGALSLVIRL